MQRRLTLWGAAALALLAACNFEGAGVRPGEDGPPTSGDAREEPRADGMASDAPAPADAPIDAASPIDAPTDAAPPDAPACPAGYFPIEIDGQPSTSRYRVVDIGNEPDWLGAEQDCANDGPTTHLAVIDSAEENAALAPFIVDGIFDGDDDEAWIGVSDLVAEGEFLSVTGDLVCACAGQGSGSCGSCAAEPGAFVGWRDGEPNDEDGEDCVELKNDGTWNDVSCAEQRDYLCECDGTAPDPDSHTPETGG